MTNLKGTLLSAIALFILTGCYVQSLNPHYSREQIITLPGIEGDWRLLDDKGKPEDARPWVFGKDKATATEKGGISGKMKTVYFRIGETVFMDSVADEPAENTSKWWTMHVFPVHLVSRVEIKDKSLTLTPLDYSWFEKAIKNKNISLPYIKSGDGEQLMFTASPEEWTVFLKKYSGDPAVFSTDNALRFVR